MEAVLHLTVLLSLAALLWQLCWFMRTDVYYVMADLLRCRNLHEDAWAYLRSRPRAWLGRDHGGGQAPPSARERRIVRGYALFALAGSALYLALFGAYVVGTLAFVVSGTVPDALAYAGDGSAADRTVAALVLGLLAALLAASVWRTRRNRRTVPRYQLVAPPGL